MGSESTEPRRLSFFSSQLISTQVSQKVSALNLLMCLMYFIFIPSKKAEKLYVAVLLGFGKVVQEKKKILHMYSASTAIYGWKPFKMRKNQMKQANAG